MRVFAYLGLFGCSLVLLAGCGDSSQGTSGAGQNIGTTSSGRGGSTLMGGGAQTGSASSEDKSPAKTNQPASSPRK
jgi:hypothetical protein